MANPIDHPIEAPRKRAGSSVSVLRETLDRFRRPSWSLAIRLLASIAVIGTSVDLGGTWLGYGGIASLAILVVPIHRAKAFLAAFVPYTLIWVVFTAIRALAGR